MGSYMAEEWQGKWALVTGASAGIGVALAEELARGGTNLVLTARRKDRLDTLAQRLASNYKVQTTVFPADLADPTAPGTVFAFRRDKGIEIDLLVNHAVCGTYGKFPAVHKDRLIEMIQVNCAAVM